MPGLFFQSKKHAEIELQNFALKLESERGSHKETVAKFNMDKKNILMSTEEANMEAMRGKAKCFLLKQIWLAFGDNNGNINF